jgi:hypothetical protein
VELASLLHSFGHKDMFRGYINKAFVLFAIIFVMVLLTKRLERVTSLVVLFKKS